MTNTKQAPILVTGGTGKVGRRVVTELLQRGLDVRIGSRSPEKAAFTGASAVQLDFDDVDSLTPALEGVEIAFLTTGYSVDMLRQSKAFIDAARHSGVKHIVHLGACGDDDTLVPHWAWHQYVEHYIEWAGLGFTHLRPEFFMENLLGYPGRRVIVDGLIKGYVGDARASWVACDDIALVAAECLAEPALHAGKTYRLGYDSKSYAEIATILSEVVGRPFSYRSLPPEAFLEEVMANGSEPAYMRSVYFSHVAAASGKLPDPDPVFENFPSITGRTPMDWRAFAEKHRADFAY